jgi:preprotein translocase subunit YajC
MHALSILASGDDSGGGSSITLLLFLIIPVAMYFLMIRPQRKRLKDQNALQAAIDVGDEVVTNSGIYGFITGVDGDKFWLEVDDDVQIRIARAAIQGRVNQPVTPAEPAKPAGDRADDPADDGATDDS